LALLFPFIGKFSSGYLDIGSSGSFPPHGGRLLPPCFTAIVHRKDGVSSEKGSPKSSLKIIELMQQDPEITIPEIAQSVGVTDRAIKKQIEKLKIQGKIRRVGPARGGRWEVIE